MKVFVISLNNKPLMPCSPMVARLLLKQNKAKVKKKCPFTIKLTYRTKTEMVDDLTLGIDPGSGFIGSAVVNNKGEVFYQSQVEVRNNISRKMIKRRNFRRFRRSKLRYRPARFKNRKNSTRKDRFAPTIKSKIDSHLKEIKFVKEILPIKEVILEVAQFDTTALANPVVLTNHKLYQQGFNYLYANRKAAVLARDQHTCQAVGCKTGDKKLHVHHIIFRRAPYFGSDHQDNLITLCSTCHNLLHQTWNGQISQVKLKKPGKKKQTKDATQMNVICSQLKKRLPNVKETFGYITKMHRQFYGLEKSHINDAIMIATKGLVKPIIKNKQQLYKKCVSDGDYSQVILRNSKRIKIERGKLYGFRLFDKIVFEKNIYFISGKRKRGTFTLMDINGIQLTREPKYTKLKRIQARKSWLLKIKI